MTLAKTDLDIAGGLRRRARADEDSGLFDTIREELAARWRRCSGDRPDRAARVGPDLRRTLELRDSYLAPLHALQTSLLARSRAVPDERAGPRRGAGAAADDQRHRGRAANTG